MGNPIRVLYVDADRPAAERAATALVERGPFEVLGVDTGDAAVERVCDREGIECVVVAHGPELDGIALVSRLAGERPDLPVVVYPHEGSEHLASRAIDAGAAGYVASTADDPYQLLASQLSRAARAGRERRRETDRHRVIDVVREISQSAVRADTREELERTICEQLAGTGPYLAAVIGSVNPETGETVPRAWAGVDGVAIERIVGAGDGPTSGLQVDAVETGETRVREFDEDDDAALGATTGNGDRPVTVRVERAAAIPITYGERLYGVLSVYAAARHAFDDAELDVLVDLCETTGHAIDGIETRRALERRQEELTRKNERLDAFASVVSHDLRNPLEIADGYVRKAHETGDDEDFEEALSGIERAKTIVEDLLVLARSDRRIRETEAIDFAETARRAWRHVDTGAADLVVESTGTVHADPSQLQRLLENAYRNSVEHGSTGSQNSPSSGDSVEHGSTGSQNSPSSGDSVKHGSTGSQNSPSSGDSVEHGSKTTVAAEESVDPQSVTTGPDDGVVTVTVGTLDRGFYVADDGPGIPEADRDDVFDAGYTTDHDGTGLGLSIVERIVDAHGWTVDVTESADGGARFEVTTDTAGDATSE